MEGEIFFSLLLSQCESVKLVVLGVCWIYCNDLTGLPVAASLLNFGLMMQCHQCVVDFTPQWAN